MHPKQLPLLLLFATLFSVASPSLNADESGANSDRGKSKLPKNIASIINNHCIGCHSAEQKSGGVRLDVLKPDFVYGANAEDWHEVLNVLNLGEMPPSDEPELPQAERRAIVDWITGELQRAAESKTSTAGKTVLRRLTRYEYNNTMADLLGVEWNYADSLPPDSKSKDGFENNGQSLGISPLQLEYYLKAARLGLSKAIVEGERPEFVEKVITKSQASARRSNYTLHENGRVFPGQAFIGKTLQFPREGMIRIKVLVDSIEVPEGQGYPRMLLRVGHRADTISPEAPFAVSDVIPNAGGGPMELQFTGRIEATPLPGHNPKFPGFVITVANAYETGTQYKALKRKQTDAARRLNKYKKAKAKAQQQGKPEPEPPEIETVELPEMPSFLVKSITFEGPIDETWPPVQHQQILFDRPAEMDETDYAQAVIQRFVDRAFRRPATEQDVARVLGYYKSIRPDMPSFETAIRESLAMVLISPEFLYLVEPLDDSETDRLNDHELATRLSYLLWSTMPDDELRGAADRGELSNPKQLEKQVRRMIGDERSQAFVKHFTSQWLGLSGVDRVAVNPQYYPTFDDQLKNDMKQETIEFVGEILRSDRSAMNLIDSDFAMLNRPLAQHYGLPMPMGQEFERVPLAGEHRRGGLLTQASILLMNSNGEDSHPIRRAVWLRDRLLDDPPTPPPPDVPDLDASNPNFASLSLKQQLELHRQKSACADCHQGIDPWGIPLENYDAVGLWREQVTRLVNRKTIESPVVSDAVLPSGQQVADIHDLKTVLTTDLKDRFARGLVRYMLAYSLGRSLDYTDEEEINKLTADFEASDYQLDELIVAITGGDAFHTK